jgi:hypothetical protein
MKKTLLFTLCLLLISFTAMAEKFVFIPVSEKQNLETLFDNNDLKIHYYCDNYVLATTDNLNFEGIVVLDENAFGDVNSYSIVYCFENEKASYLQRTSGNARTLYSGENFFIMKATSGEIMPAKNDGMIAITNTPAMLPKSIAGYPVITNPDAGVQDLINQVNIDTVMGYIQHLENFVTRYHSHANCDLAQNWIESKKTNSVLMKF